MKTILIATIAALTLTLAFGGGISIALADAPILVQENGEPIGGCPLPFELHHAVDHDHDHGGEHHHIGTDTDKNLDGWICVNPSGKDNKNHVHIDNNLPL